MHLVSRPPRRPDPYPARGGAAEHLREIGELSKDVVLVGQLSRFEIWDKQKWEEEFQRARERFSEASQSLSQLGL